MKFENNVFTSFWNSRIMCSGFFHFLFFCPSHLEVTSQNRCSCGISPIINLEVTKVAATSADINDHWWTLKTADMYDNSKTLMVIRRNQTNFSKKNILFSNLLSSEGDRVNRGYVLVCVRRKGRPRHFVADRDGLTLRFANSIGPASQYDSPAPIRCIPDALMVFLFVRLKSPSRLMRHHLQHRLLMILSTVNTCTKARQHHPQINWLLALMRMCIRCNKCNKIPVRMCIRCNQM